MSTSQATLRDSARVGFQPVEHTDFIFAFERAEAVGAALAFSIAVALLALGGYRKWKNRTQR